MQKTKLGNFFRVAAPISFVAGLLFGAWRGDAEGAEAVFNFALFFGLGLSFMIVLYVGGYLIDGVWFETRTDERIAKENASFASGNRLFMSACFAVPVGLALVYNRDPAAFTAFWRGVIAALPFAG
jgi:cytochrome bd-type quinol oxidase subunit 2